MTTDADAPDTRPVAFRLAYDGRGYAGFQRQPDVQTIEGVLFEAFDRLEVPFGADDAPAGYAAAGRTDAGVSALCQTVGLRAPPWVSAATLSEALPDTIHAWASAPVPPTFHATHDACRRTYVYQLPAADLDEAALRRAGDALAGMHDYHNLVTDAETARRRLEIDISVTGSWCQVTVTSSGFERHLVRRLVAVMACVGRGEVSLARIGRLLEAEAVPGHLNVGPAPPESLVLTDVTYPAVTFEVDADAREEAHHALSETISSLRTQARTLRTIRRGLDGSGME